MGHELLIEGVLFAIAQHFPGITLYKDDVPSGFQRPCFYVQAREPSQKARLHYQVMRDYPFAVHYFPSGDDRTREECRKVGDVLLDILEFIEPHAEFLRRGKDIDMKITEDKVLIFHVTYTLQASRVMDYDKMQTLDVIETIKED